MWEALPLTMSKEYMVLQRRYSARNAPRSVSLGLEPLDRLLGPLGSGELLWVVGPGASERMSLALGLALHVARQQAALFVSAEHAMDQLSSAALAATARVPLSALRTGRLSKNEHWPKVADAVEELHVSQLYWAVQSGGGLPALRASLLRYCLAEGQPALVVVDGLHCLDSSGSMDPRALVELARDLDVALVVTVAPGFGPTGPTGLPPLRRLGKGLLRLSAVPSDPVEPQGPRSVSASLAVAPAELPVPVLLRHDPRFLAWWHEASAPVALAAPSPGSVSRREGMRLDPVYSAACCALLHQVGLAHYWDGRPHGPGRAWQLPENPRLSDLQRLVVRVALDIWDNQGGVRLRELRSLSPTMVATIGELIADTAGPDGPVAWLERQLGPGWHHWVAEKRWEELLGVGWRDVLGSGDAPTATPGPELAP